MIKLVEEKCKVVLQYYCSDGESYWEDVGHSLLHTLPKFCFPEDGMSPMRWLEQKPTEDSETFSLVLTDEAGTKQYSYCRRFLTYNGSDQELTCLALVSSCPSFNMYSVLLDVLEAKISQDAMNLCSEFLETRHVITKVGPAHVPEIGERLSLGSGDVKLTCSPGNDYLLDYISFSSLFAHVSLDHIMDIFQLLLSEQRLVLASDTLSTLTECINGATALLSPFAWQHVLIPVLPHQMISYLCAPVPFLVGVLTPVLPMVAEQANEMEGCSIFHVEQDKWIVKNEEQFNSVPMPRVMVDQLCKSLSGLGRYSSQSCGRGFEVAVARRMHYFFLGVFKGYEAFMDSAEPFQFDATAFLETAQPVVATFLRCFMKTQMFRCFFAERSAMKRSGSLGTCILLKACKQPRESMLLSPMSVFECSKCGDVLDAAFDTRKGNPICSKCSQRKRGGARAFFHILKSPMKGQVAKDKEKDEERGKVLT